MKCQNCSGKLETIESRSLETNDGISFVRRTKRCKNKHLFITHEMTLDISPIPDIYRVKRVRKANKPKPKKIHSLDWVERIQNKLNEL
jgi:hypothetical protein